MSNARATAVPALVLSRVYDASPERVYAAWTDPQAAMKFLGPGDVKAIDVEMDVRVGGAYQIVMVKPDGERLPVRGVYKEVVPSRRLSMTWQWEEDNPEDEYETLLTLEFFDRDGKTELVLTHENFATIETRSNHEEGWTAILDQFAQALRR